MTRNHNGGPQYPRDFLEELQRESLEAIEQASLGQPDPTQLDTPPAQPVSSQDSSEVIAAIAIFSTKALREVYDLMGERDEAVRDGKALREENKQMRLTIVALNDTIAARDARIEEMNARIETLTRGEKVKLQTA